MNQRGFIIGWLIFVAFSSFPAFGSVVINELLASASAEDENGSTLEWIELHNAGTEAESLAGYALTDDPLAPYKFRLPVIDLPPDAYLLIWATGYGLLDPGNYHANFQLRREGEYLALFQPNGTAADEIRFPEQRRNISYGRAPGGKAWLYFANPTPGKANGADGKAGFASAPIFSVAAGVYPDSVNLTLSTPEPETKIRYTLDGAPPEETSELYLEPIRFYVSTPVRARVFRPNYFPSDIVTNTYIMREKMVLPILSLVAKPADLFDSRTGIYANPVQHGRAWERVCSVEFFTMEGRRGFQEDCGVRIHGGASRSRSPKKSFRLYFRSDYGKARLEYPLFPGNPVQRFNQLVLRAGFNDSWGYDREMQRVTVINVRDQVCRDIFMDMGQLACDGLFAELYINGTYWGLYNPTERTDNDFYRQHLGGEAYDVIVEGALRDGDMEEWNLFKTFVTGARDFSADGDYGNLLEYLDLENFVSYVILNVWMQNYDWPHHNWYAAREKSAAGEWRFDLWDVEYSFGSGINGYQVAQNTFENAAGDTDIGNIFRKALKNEQFKAKFWNKTNAYLETALNEAHVMERLNQRLDEVRAAVPAEAEMWGRDKTPKDWEKAAQLARDFVKARTPIFLNYAEKAVGPRPVFVEEWALY
ncbi:MAG: CotH kinase family protein [Candidatus Omnitrophota bacterium]